jgi:hypothetical protein
VSYCTLSVCVASEGSVVCVNQTIETTVTVFVLRLLVLLAVLAQFHDVSYTLSIAKAATCCTETVTSLQ